MVSRSQGTPGHIGPMRCWCTPWIINSLGSGKRPFSVVNYQISSHILTYRWIYIYNIYIYSVCVIIYISIYIYIYVCVCKNWKIMILYIYIIISSFIYHQFIITHQSVSMCKSIWWYLVAHDMWWILHFHPLPSYIVLRYRSEQFRHRLRTWAAVCRRPRLWSWNSVFHSVSMLEF